MFHMSNFESIRIYILILCFFPLGWFIRTLFLLNKPKYRWWHFAIIIGGLILGSLIERAGY